MKRLIACLLAAVLMLGCAAAEEAAAPDPAVFARDEGILRLPGKQWALHSLKKMTSAKVAQICSFIDEHYAAIHSIDDIAENCFISKYYMCREFKRQTGKTVGSYLSERRMTAAKELLLHTDRNVSAIARDTGFEAENYFFFVFKKAEGLTPLQYRKQFKQLDPQ